MSTINTEELSYRFNETITQHLPQLLQSPEQSLTGFIKNDGQFVDPSISFVAMINSSLVLFRNSEVTYQIPSEATFYYTRLDFVGADLVQPIGESAASNKLNLFYGESSYTNLRLWNEIWYRSIYPNIDLRYYFVEDNLKYDFIINPGATPIDISMRYNELEEIFISSDSVRVILESQFEISLRDSDLLVVQKDGVKVEAGFCEKNGLIGFDIQEYDTTQQLVIDPLIELDYGSYLGGEDMEPECRAVVGDDGYIYVAGTTYSSLFPLVNPIYSYVTMRDCFVSKLDPSGSTLLYSTFVGGSESEAAQGIALDSDGCVYVTGYTTSTNFPRVNTSTYTSDDVDCFVFKLNPEGTGIVYSCFVSGNDKTFGNDIAVGDDGTAYITGFCYAEFLNGEVNHVDIDEEYGQYNLLVAKVDPTGSHIAVTGLYGGSQGSYGSGIDVGEDGRVYIIGYCISADFPLSNPMRQFAGDRDVVLMVLDSSFTQVFSSFIGGEKWEHGTDLVVGEGGIVYLTGETISDDFPTSTYAFSEARISKEAYEDCFITKIDTIEREILFSTYLGGSEHDLPYSIATDEAGRVYVTGWTNSRDFPDTENPYSYFLEQQGFFAVLSETGRQLLCSTLFGGYSSDVPFSISLDPNGDVILAGRTDSTDFPVCNGYNHSYGGERDCFLLRYSLNWSELHTPLMNEPNDIQLKSGVTRQIVWKVYDYESVNYQILVNGSTLTQGVCYPEVGVVQVDVLHQTTGVFNYTIFAWNSQGSNSTDDVFVFVEPTLISYDLLFLSVSIAGSAGIVILIILEIRNRH